MYCANCGTEHEGDAKFCRACGQTFVAETGSGDLALASGGRLGALLEGHVPTDLTHERVSAILGQAAGLLALVLAVLAIARKPSPGLFLVYALPLLLGSVVTVLERRATVGKAVFVLAMLAPYFSLFVVGVPPFFVSGLQDLTAAAAGLGGYMTLTGFSAFFLLLGFLLLVFSPIATLIVHRHPAVAGLIALAASLAFSVVFMLSLGTPAGAVTRSVTIEEKLDSAIVIHATATLPADDGTVTDTTTFKSNELIYPYVEGLRAGTKYGFRLVDANGKTVVDYDRGDANQAKGKGLEKAAALNTVDGRVAAGSYTLELLASEGWHTTLLSRADVTVTSDVNPNYGNDTQSAFAWFANGAGAASTSFAATDAVHLILDGSRVQDGVSLLVKDGADKIVLDKQFTAMPLGKSDYTLTDKAAELGSGQFVAALTTEGKETITIYFTVEK